MLPFGGAVTFSTPSSDGERQSDQPLLHVERVRLRAGPDQHDRRDARRIGGVDLKHLAVAERAGSDAGDRRPRGRRAVGVEQIGGRVDLDVLLVGAACRVSAHQHDGRVRQEQRPGVIQARIGVGARGAERVRGRIVEIGVQAALVAASSSFTDPPMASTLPFGRMVAFISIRGWDIGGPNCHDGVGAPTDR